MADDFHSCGGGHVFDVRIAFVHRVAADSVYGGTIIVVGLGTKQHDGAEQSYGIARLVHEIDFAGTSAVHLVFCIATHSQNLAVFHLGGSRSGCHVEDVLSGKSAGRFVHSGLSGQFDSEAFVRDVPNLDYVGICLVARQHVGNDYRSYTFGERGGKTDPRGVVLDFACAFSHFHRDITDLVGTLAHYHEVCGFRFRDGLFVVPFVPREGPEGEFVAQHADHCIDWYDL